MKFSRIAAILLCIALIFTAAFAEIATTEESEAAAAPVSAAKLVPTAALHDLEIMVGPNQYSFPMSIAQAKEAGIVFDDEAAIYADSDVAEGKWFSAGNGRSAFKVVVKILPSAIGAEAYDENNLYVAGISVNNQGPQPVELAGGLLVNDASYEDAVAVFGEPAYANDAKDYVKFSLSRDLTQYLMEFEDGVLESVEAYTLLGDYGLEFSPAAPDAELPEPTSMHFNHFIINGKLYTGKLTYQDLAADGWAMRPADAELALDPANPNSFIIRGNVVYLYNGEGLLQVFLYNASENECTLSDASVLYLGANRNDGTSLVLADALTIGSTYDAVTATFGTNADVSEEDTYTFYEYTGLSGGAACGFSVADNEVIYLRVQP